MNDGWQPLSKPKKDQPKPRRAGTSKPVRTEGGTFVVDPFIRLVRVHAMAGVAGGLVFVAMADSLFLSVDPSAARWRVGLYLLFTMLPFLVVSPLIGPALDRSRGGRRLMVVAMMAVSSVVALLMVGSLDSLLLFPLAFGMLVLQKGYAIAKSALVPSVCKSAEELVDRNSRLTIIGGIATGVGGALGAALTWIAGSGLSVLAAAIAYGVCAWLALRLPKVAVAADPEAEEERQEVRTRGIRLASSGIGMLRAIEGFLFFLVLFAYRGGTDGVDLSGVGSKFGARMAEELGFPNAADSGISVLQLGLALGAIAAGKWAGAFLAPRLRTMIQEELIIAGALGAVTVAGILGVFAGGLGSAVMVGFIFGLALAGAKLSFDSLVQRDAPAANYGRQFAKFETRFQLLWVVGAIVPVALSIPARFGFLVIGLGAGFAAFTYYVGQRAPEPTGPQMVEPPVPQPLGNTDPTMAEAPGEDRPPADGVDTVIDVRPSTARATEVQTPNHATSSHAVRPQPQGRHSSGGGGEDQTNPYPDPSTDPTVVDPPTRPTPPPPGPGRATPTPAPPWDPPTRS